MPSTNPSLPASAAPCETSAFRNGCLEFLIFGLNEARACLFAGSFMAVLVISNWIPLGPLPRYDFILLAAVAIQIALLAGKIETEAEACTLCLFHLIGLCLEIFKTHPSVNSWSYPEDAYSKLGTVPLYSGFMYAAVASYMCQAWRIFDLQLEKYPPRWLTIALCLAIYGNFFANHFVPDSRLFLIPLVLLIFCRTQVCFVVWKGRERRMPLLISFFLIGFFVWVAENFSTFFGAWVYPNQQSGWKAVEWQKVSSWFLLVIISFVIVADLKHWREDHQAKSD
jgi:uncharacterized membrane protein YoaT (DUF817 family)